jgi:2-methylcitrate dehydratase
MINRRTFLESAGLGSLMLAAQASRGAGQVTGMQDNRNETDMNKVKNPARSYTPIATGPSQAEGIAKFACRTKYADLTPERRERLKVSVLDSLACAVNALGAPPIQACLAQAKEFGGPDGRCSLIGGGQANIMYAAFYNTALVRYIDWMDSYLAGAEICHPSDNTGAVLAASEHVGSSGKDFLTALAVAYQVDSVLTASAPFMADGFDMTTQLSFSVAAGASKALGLDEAKAAAAVEICGDTGLPLLVLRTTPISEWKGLMSSQVALGCVHGVLLASRGVTGPKYVIEGSNGLSQAVGRSIRVDWEQQALDCFDHLCLKSYNSAVPGQSAICCMLELRKAHPFNPADVLRIDAYVFQDAYDFLGGGKFGPKTVVHTKNDADHSLPYLLAVAAIDGDVQTAQLEPSRIARPDVQTLLQKVVVKPDAGFTARYPAEMLSRVSVRLGDGTSYEHEVKDYAGFQTRPFTWEEVGAKFDKLAGDRIDAALSQDIKAAVASLEKIQVKDLMNLLVRINAG